MDALDRGSLLHDALENFWEVTRNSKRLSEMDREARQEIIDGAVRNALSRFAGRRSLGRGYTDSLHAWLTRLVGEWLKLENMRAQEFSVIATEHDVDLELADMRLSLRIDRVDRLASGSIVLIDYKSGQTPGVARWVGHPPQYRSEYPQLGLYAVAAKNSADSLLQGEIEALLVATLKLGAEGFAGFTVESAFFGKGSGVSQAPPTLDKVRNLEESLKDWSLLIEQWESSFISRIDEFKEGYAEVDPLPGACVFCDLQTLCRIQELGKQEAADD